MLKIRDLSRKSNNSLYMNWAPLAFLRGEEGMSLNRNIDGENSGGGPVSQARQSREKIQDRPQS